MSEDITDKLLHKTITIEIPNGKLVYNFGFLKGNQCEMGHSLGIFLTDQQENPASSFEDLIKSGSANWRFTLMGYLFIKEGDENKPKDEDYFKAIREIFNSIDMISQSDGITTNYYPLFKEVIQDFFSGIGEPWIASMLLPNKSKERMTQKWLPILMQILGSTKGNNLNTLKDESESKLLTTKANSKKEEGKTS